MSDMLIVIAVQAVSRVQGTIRARPSPSSRRPQLLGAFTRRQRHSHEIGQQVTTRTVGVPDVRRVRRKREHRRNMLTGVLLVARQIEEALLSQFGPSARAQSCDSTLVSPRFIDFLLARHCEPRTRLSGAKLGRGIGLYCDSWSLKTAQ